MKKVNLAMLIALFFVAGAVSAQVSFGIKGGVNLASIYGEGSTGAKMKPGFHVGVTGEVGFMPLISVKSGLMFVNKGYNGPKGSEYTAGLSYLQVPVHIAYKMPLLPAVKLQLYGGPYAAFGITGNIKSDGEKVASFSKEGGAKRFDMGLGAGADVIFGKITAGIGIDFGLTPLSEDTSMKNNNFLLSVGYLF